MSALVRFFIASSSLAAVFVSTANTAFAAELIGRTKGQFNVNETGAANYSIPIAVAEAAGDMKPNISLAYNSQIPDGIAGVGWEISGLSKIERCGKTPHVNGERTSVTFSANDRFCLDGQQLLIESQQSPATQYGDDGVEYRTELHDQQKIISYGSYGSGPLYFIVKHPNGLTYQYGYWNDSRIEDSSIGEIKVWALSKVYDKFANSTVFEYEEHGDFEYTIKKIIWGGQNLSPTSASAYSLEFSYDPRSDTHDGYIGGAPWATTKRLTNITYKHQGSVVHNYELTYEAPAIATGASRLMQVQKCAAAVCSSGDPDRLKRTWFTWQNGSLGWNSTSTATNNWGQYFTFVDYDGDGDMDVISGDVGGNWQLQIADGGLLGVAQDIQAHNGGSQLVTLPVVGTASQLDELFSIAALDVNGDGFGDALIRGSDDKFHVILADGGIGCGDFCDITTSIPYSNDITGASGLDIDGDGQDELVYVKQDGVYFHETAGANFSSTAVQTSIPATPPQGGSYIMYFNANRPQVDFNGDGRHDLVLLVLQGNCPTCIGTYYDMYLSEGDDFPETPFGSTRLNNYELHWTNAFQTPDINGDGLTDLAFTSLDDVWHTMISDGTQFVDLTDTTIQGGNVGKSVVVDYDRDGRSDLRAQVETSPGVFGYQLFLSTNSSYTAGSSITGGLGEVDIDPIDINGDGYQDVLYLNGTQRRVKLAGGNRADLMTFWSDGLSNFAIIKYVSLLQSPIYQSSGLPPKGGALYVVEDYQRNDGATATGTAGMYTVDYQYTGGKRDATNRNQLSFEKIKAHDERSGIDTEIEFKQNYPYVGRAWQTTTKKDSVTLTQNTVTWNHALATSPVAPNPDYYQVYAGQSDSYTYEPDDANEYQRQLTEITWNAAHGVPETTEIWQMDHLHATKTAGFYTKIDNVSFDGGLKSGQWCLGRATQVDVTKTFSSAVPGTEMRSISSIYDQLKCYSTSTTKGSTSDLSKQLITTTVMDDFGRVDSVTVDDGNVGSGEAERKTSFVYPNTFTSRPSTETRHAGGTDDHVTSMIWDEALGLETSRTSPQNVNITTQYDVFGRFKRRDNVTLGTWSTADIVACSNWCAQATEYAISESSSDGSFVETQYDRYGRPIRITKSLIGTDKSYQWFEYDSRGRRTLRSIPRLTNTTNQGDAIIYLYDDHNRATEERRPIDENDTTWQIRTYWTYAGSSITTQDDKGLKTTNHYRPDGALRQAFDDDVAGTYGIYQYTPFGELASVRYSDDSGPTTTLTYDPLGNPDLESSVDTGDWDYDYNVFGELVSQSDDQGNSVTITYDQLGRRTQRDDNPGITTWTYKQSGNGFGLLDRIVQIPAALYTKTYTYNAAAQLTQTDTALDGFDFQTNYTYDSQGRLETMKYPIMTGGEINRPLFTYGYSNGYLSSIDQDNGTGGNDRIYSVESIDALGRETHAVQGDGFLTNLTDYDDNTLRVKSIKSTAALVPAGNTLYQDYTYQWDEVGNLTSRTDNISSIDETLKYDSKYRLKETWLANESIRTQVITYHADGRINTKLGDNGYKGVGTYTYAPGDSNAVTNVTGDRSLDYVYDGNGNMICRGDTVAACTNGDAISWTSFNKPETINFTNGSRVDYSTFTYGPDRRRVKQVVKDAGFFTTATYYVDSHFEYDKESSNAKHIYRAYVFANGRVVYEYEEKKTTGECSTTYEAFSYFLLRDHQGSVDKIVLWDETVSSPTASYSFDAYGKRRNADWTPDDQEALLNVNHQTERGYTGHEHLDNVRLIHMNGRVQDPILGRMISADPLIGDLATPQSLNRYSYVLNNPASFTDPSGFEATGSDSDPEQEAKRQPQPSNSPTPKEEMVKTVPRPPKKPPVSAGRRTAAFAASINAAIMADSMKSLTVTMEAVFAFSVAEIAAAAGGLGLALYPVAMGDATLDGTEEEGPDENDAAEAGDGTLSDSEIFGDDNNDSNGQAAGHRTGARPSTEEKHQKGDKRRATDSQHREKGDKRRKFNKGGPGGSNKRRK